MVRLRGLCGSWRPGHNIVTCSGAHDTGTRKGWPREALQREEKPSLRLRPLVLLSLISSLAAVGMLKGSNCTIHTKCSAGPGSYEVLHKL